MDKRAARKVHKAATTTKGTPRQGAEKGQALELRRQALEATATDGSERLLQLKLKQMSETRRRQVEAQVNRLSDDTRRVYLVDLLSR